ncbi:MAG: hypothetical protein ACRCTD_15040 [Beijerinckiaceae bacterium]
MKSFVMACIAVVFLSVAAASILETRQATVDEKFARASVRLDAAKTAH